MTHFKFCFAVLMLCFSGQALANLNTEKQFEFDIQTSSLSSVISRLAQTVNCEVLFVKGVDVSQNAPGVRGVFTLDQALRRVFTGLKLGYEIIGVQLRIYAAHDTSIILPTVTVEGELYPHSLQPIWGDDTQARFPSYRDPNSVYSIPSSTTEKQYAHNIEQAVSYAAGVEYYSRNAGITPTFYSRGLSIPYSIDGKYYRRGSIPLDPSVIERFDFAFGPSASSLEPGGAINFVMKTPELDSKVNGTSVIGTNDFYKMGFDVNFAEEKDAQNAARLILALNEKKDRKPYVFENSYVIAPQYLHKFNGEGELLVNTYYRKLESYPNDFVAHESTLVRPLPESISLGMPWAKGEVSDTYLSIDISAIPVKGWQFGFGANWREDTIDNLVTPVVPLSEDSALVLQVHALGIVNRSYGTDLSFERDANIFNTSVYLRLGIDAQAFDSLTPFWGPSEFLGIVNLYANEDQRVLPRLEVEREGEFNQWSRFVSVYLSSYVPISNRLALYNDIRFEKIDVEGVFNIVHGDDAGRYWKLESDRFEFVPQASLVYSTDQYRYQLSYAKSYSNQNVFDAENIESIDNFETDYVAPIANRQYEFSIGTDWGDGKPKSRLIIYDIKRSGVRTITQESSETYGGLVNDVAPDQHSSGASLGVYGKVNASLDYDVNVNYNRNTISVEDAGGVVGGIGLTQPLVARTLARYGTANWVLNTWINYYYKTLTLGVGFKYVGDKYAEEENNLKIASYRKVDVGISYAGLPNTEISLNIKNLFNTKYYEGSLGTTYLIEEGDLRSLYLGLKYDFDL